MSSRPIYVHCTGQDDNIGDVVLRRRLLTTLRAHGVLHILTKSTSAGFIEALALDAEDLVFASRREWFAHARRNAAVPPAVLVNNPGEMLVGPLGLLRQLWLVPLRRAVSRSGGVVVQLGVGVSRRPGLQRWLLAAAFRYHHLVYWRDPVSRESLGFGSVMPDWGFADRGAGQPPARPGDRAARDRLAVSLRADRPYPGATWLRAVRRYAETAGLRAVVVTQVRRDQQRSRQLARDLGATLLGWEEETHAEQEAKLREIYRRCRTVLSDRLHVLVLGMTEGAIPACLLDRREDKVGRHFDAIGYPDASLDVSGKSAREIAAILERTGARGEEMRRCRARANALIGQVEREFANLLVAAWASCRTARALALEPSR